MCACGHLGPSQPMVPLFEGSQGGIPASHKNLIFKKSTVRVEAFFCTILPQVSKMLLSVAPVLSGFVLMLSA